MNKKKNKVQTINSTTKSAVDLCGILFHHEHSIKDITGCLKEYAHNDEHIFISADGRLIKWEEDYECTCGCWDRWEETSGREKPCILYSDIPYKKVSDLITIPEDIKKHLKC